MSALAQRNFAEPQTNQTLNPKQLTEGQKLILTEKTRPFGENGKKPFILQSGTHIEIIQVIQPIPEQEGHHGFLHIRAEKVPGTIICSFKNAANFIVENC